jgi:hypothetical protein
MNLRTKYSLVSSVFIECPNPWLDSLVCIILWYNEPSFSLGY